MCERIFVEGTEVTDPGLKKLLLNVRDFIECTSAQAMTLYMSKSEEICLQAFLRENNIRDTVKISVLQEDSQSNEAYYELIQK